MQEDLRAKLKNVGKITEEIEAEMKQAVTDWKKSFIA